MALHKKTFYIIGSTLFLLVVLILVLLPYGIKNYTVKNSKELIGRQIQFNKLNLNYFTGNVQVTDFKMFEPDDKTNFVTFDTLIVNLEPYKFLWNEKVVERFYLKGLFVNVIMKDSVFNFDDLIAFHAAQEDTLATKAPEETFKYSLSNLELKNANFVFHNENIGDVTDIDNFSFFIPFIGWDQNHKSNADIQFNFKNGGYFASKLNINPNDGAFDATINLRNLNLEPFYKYTKEYAEINSLSGNLNSQIKIVGNTKAVENAIASGHLDVNNLEMTDTNNKKFLGAKKININLKKLDYAQNSYELDSLDIRSSYTFFQLDSTTNNFYKIFKLDGPTNKTVTDTTVITTSDSTASNPSTLHYVINHLNLTDGVLEYTDNLTGEPFNYHLSQIKINTNNVSSDAKWLDINADMLLNNRGTLKAELGFNPSNTLYANLDIAIKNFLLSDINIYSKYYTGNSILQGEMFYYSNSKITNGDILSENKWVIRDVAIDDSKKGIYKLPLRLALFLLKDKNGDITLDVPVRGDLKNPKINVGKIIWTTFKNIIFNTASKPVNFLAGLVDGDPKQFEEITFSYLDTIPSEAQFKTLDKLLEIESKKEGLKIEMVHYYDRELQKEAIALDQLGKEFERQTQKDYLKNGKEFEEFVKAKAVSDSIIISDSLNLKDTALKLIDKTSLDSLAKAYNQNLLNNTTQYLKTAKDSTQITIRESDPQKPENTGSKSKFKINYGLLDDSETRPQNP